MSRSGYTDDCDDDLAAGRWRGRVTSAMRGKRGQALLRDLLAALDAMPVKELIAHELEADGSYCTLGVLGAARGMDLKKLDPEDYDSVAAAFGIAPCMAQEIVYMNDEFNDEVWDAKLRQSFAMEPAERWRRMREWVAKHIKPAA